MITQIELQKQVLDIINANPVLADRVQALKMAGFEKIHYCYVKNLGIGRIHHLKKKKVYRVQIAHTELQKAYPAAWVIDVSEVSVDQKIEMPF